MPELEQAAKAEDSATGRYFVRFTRERRYMHAVLFTTFLGLAATGLPMRFSESFWARKFAAGVGGFGAILFFHKFCALVLTVAFLSARMLNSLSAESSQICNLAFPISHTRALAAIPMKRESRQRNPAHYRLAQLAP